MHGYIWEPAWCWPYESAWSIMEKFKYANAVTNSVFKKIFRLRSTSPEWNIVQDLYIYRRSKIDESEFFKFFQISDDHFSFLNKLRNNDFRQVFHRELHYCPKCMIFGYHSYLHQLSFASSCPFHDEQLLCLKYNGKTVSYSIDFMPTEAYSAMQAGEKHPAERYVNILPSRSLIDGIWQIAPDHIKIADSAIHKIIFFNPSVEPAEPVKPIINSTFKLVDSLSNDRRNIKCRPVFHIDTKSCDMGYHGLLSRSVDWFESKCQVFNIGDLECWFVAMLIEELIQDIDKEVLRYSISNMQRCEFHYQIDSEEYLKAASAVITAYIITNSRNLYEGIDNSIVYHFGTHNNKIRRCAFSIFDIDSYINSKGVINRYIPFLIFGRLFDKLYNHIFSQLQGDLKLSFYYYNAFDFIIPDYVVIQKNDFFEIFENTEI